MIFKPRQKRRTLDSVVLNNHDIVQAKEVVFWGVILDENLSWKPHILNISRKISKSIGIIYKSSFCLSAVSLRTLYFSLVYPYLIYCITVWGSTYQTNLKRIITLQKKVIKIISNVPFDAYTDNLFRDHQILKFNGIYLFQTAKFMFLYTKGFLPNTFNNMFTFTNQIDSITLEILIAFIFSHVEQTFVDFLFVFEDLSFTIHLIKKFRIVRVLVCLVNCLKNFFLQI